ncbi:MAG: hypothetical protein RL235_1026 [Chlamydiota bacterium]
MCNALFKSFNLSMLVLFAIIRTYAEPLRVEVSAASAIVMNAKSGVVLYEKNARVPAYPASVTKVATALFTIDHYCVDLGRKVTVTGEALRTMIHGTNSPSMPHWQDPAGTMMGLKRGEVVSVEDLLYGLMLASGNDAANALADALGESIPQFVDAMNDYLRSIGCLKTCFRNPHGLHHPEHVTTAYDLALMARKALTFPIFRMIVASQAYQRVSGQKKIEHVQGNQLIRPSKKHYYPKAIGIKTGYTSMAQNTLVAAARHEERELIVVLLGCPTRDDRYQDARRLFEAAFAEISRTKRVLNTDRYTKQISGGQRPLVASLKTPCDITFYPSEEPQCKAVLHWLAFSLPIEKGQVVGTIQITDERGELIVSRDIYAEEAVEMTWLEKVRRYFSNI